MYTAMKRALCIVFLLVWISTTLSAQTSTEVSLRYIKREDLVRIVVEASDDFITGANMITSTALIKIEFPSAFELKRPKDFIFETMKKDRTLTIAVKDVSAVRSYKLVSPARIVIELTLKPQNGAQTEIQKPLADKLADMHKPPLSAPPQAPQKLPDAADRVVPFRTVVLDPGHGGYDYGIFGQDIKEKDTNLNIAKDLGSALQKKGLKVFLTRKVDQSIPIHERISFSNSKNPDLLLSIHTTPSDRFAVTNATADETGSDAAIKLYRLSSRQNRHLDKSRAIAQNIADAFRAEYKTGAVTRELPLPLLMSQDAPALLIECPLTAESTYDQKDRERIINAIMKGLFGNE